MSAGAAAYPQEWELDALLADGATVHLRPIRPDDADALVAFHGSLSPQTVHRRFFTAHPRLSEQEVERFTVVDYHDRFALVATIGSELVGVARYDRVAPEAAEVAFVVADAEQGRGVGSLLLEHLAGAARQRGVGRFVADTLLGNAAMLGVFRDAGFEATSSFEAGVVHLEFPIAETPGSVAAAEERERRAEVASIRRLLRPATVAVIGASRRPGTIGHEVLRNLLDAGFGGTVYPVNPVATAVAGVRAYPGVADLPEPPDLGVVVVPARAAVDVVRQCGEAGARSVVVISAGFAETGPEGGALQAELTATARHHGMRVVGPNCLGVVNTAPDVALNATFAPTPPAGPVAFLSQSGAMGIAVLERAAALGLGVSSFVSAGNKADVSSNDLLCYWESDARTRIVLLYLESFGNPRKFARIARRVSRSKPIVAVKAGRTQAGSRAALPRAAATPEIATEALFRQAGVIRVTTMAELLDVALVLAHQAVPAGGRLAIVSNSGGPGILAADACEDAELTLAELAPETVSVLSALLPEAAPVRNPVDLADGAGTSAYEQALDAVLTDPGVDAVLVIFTPPLVTRADEVSAAVLAAAGRHPGRPLVATLLTSGMAPTTLVSGDGAVRVPVFPFPEQAVRALGRVAHYGRWLARPAGAVPDLDGVDLGRARAVATEALAGAPGDGRWLGVDETAALLGAVGVPLVGGRFAPEAGRSAARATPAPPGVETIVGVTQDPAFGPLLLFGLGGIATEVLGDTASRILPLTDVDAAELVRSVRAAPLLFGYGGAPAVDTGALEDLLLRIGLLAEQVPEVAELDLDPVVVSDSGLSVVGARVRLVPAAQGPGPLSRALRHG